MRHSSTPEKISWEVFIYKVVKQLVLKWVYPLAPLLAVSNVSLFSQTKTCNRSIIKWFRDLWEIMSILILHSGAVYPFKCIRYGLGLNRVLQIWEVATVSWCQAGLCHKPKLVLIVLYICILVNKKSFTTNGINFEDLSRFTTLLHQWVQFDLIKLGSC